MVRTATLAKKRVDKKLALIEDATGGFGFRTTRGYSLREVSAPDRCASDETGDSPSPHFTVYFQLSD
jgi:hypothetical protein